MKNPFQAGFSISSTFNNYRKLDQIQFWKEHFREFDLLRRLSVRTPQKRLNLISAIPRKFNQIRNQRKSIFSGNLQLGLAKNIIIVKFQIS